MAIVHLPSDGSIVSLSVQTRAPSVSCPNTRTCVRLLDGRRGNLARGRHGCADPGRREPPAGHPWAVVRFCRWPPATSPSPRCAGQGSEAGVLACQGLPIGNAIEGSMRVLEAPDRSRRTYAGIRGALVGGIREEYGAQAHVAGAGPSACHRAAQAGVVPVSGGRAAERVAHPRPGKVARAGTRARHASWRSGTSRIGARCAEVRSRPPADRTEGHGLEIVDE